MLTVFLTAWLAVLPTPTARAAWIRSRELGRHALTVREANALAAAADRSGWPPAVVLGLIEVESAYNPREVSSARCVGLTQVAPATAQEFRARAGVGRGYQLTSIPDNIALGSTYLRWCLDRYGRLDHALTVYNLGPARFRYRTSAYARRVLRRAIYLETRFHVDPQGGSL